MGVTVPGMGVNNQSREGLEEMKLLIFGFVLFDIYIVLTFNP
jgi:hypothetical protein